MFNAGEASRKAACIVDLINDHKLEAVAICETWIKETAPDTIKSGLAPSGFTVSHVHRPIIPDGPSRGGGGLAFLASNDFVVRPHPSQATNKPIKIEHQLVNVRIGHHVIAVATVYRPPSTSKSTFLVEFADLLISLSLQSVDCLLVCCDMNMPVCNPGTIDDDLLELLDQQSMTQ